MGWKRKKEDPKKQKYRRYVKKKRTQTTCDSMNSEDTSKSKSIII